MLSFAGLAGSSIESAYWWVSPPYHQALLERRLHGRGAVGRPARGSRCRRRCLRQVGEVAQAADRVDGVVELLHAHAGALDVAEPLGPAVAVVVELPDDVPHVAHGEVVQVVAERVVTGPPPDQRDGAGELRGLVGVAGGVERAEVDRAVRRHLVDDLAAVAVGDLADVAQRAQVCLDRRRTAPSRRWRTRCTRRRCRTATGSPASRRPASAPWPACRPEPGTPGPPRPAAAAGRATSCTESARFCLLHAMLRSSSRSPGSSTLVFASELLRGPRSSCRSAVAGSAQRGRQLAARVLDALVRARDGEPQRRRPVGRQLDVPRQLAAGALAEGAVVAGRRRRAVGGADDRRVLRTAVVRARAACDVGGGAAGDQRGPVVGRALATGGVPVLAEHQGVLVEGAGVLEVEGAGVRRRPAPRVRRHQLGVRVHGERHACGPSVR